MTTRRNPCNDMAAVRHPERATCTRSRTTSTRSPAVRARAGSGSSPTRSRPGSVINEGKLAVIEGIEVSRIFGCGEVNGVPQCNDAQIDAGLNEVHALGVRTFFPIHEFDNAFGGTKGIAGELGRDRQRRQPRRDRQLLGLQPCSAAGPRMPSRCRPATGRPARPAAQRARARRCSAAARCRSTGPGPQCNTRGLTESRRLPDQPDDQAALHHPARPHGLDDRHRGAVDRRAAITTRASSPPTAARRRSCSGGSTRRAGSSPRRTLRPQRSSPPSGPTRRRAARATTSASAGGRT